MITLAAYRAFLIAAGIPPQDAQLVFPSAAGLVSAGTAVSLTDLSAKWTPNQWAGCVVFDITQSWGAIVVSNTETEVDFTSVPSIGSDGTFVDSPAGAGNPQELTPAPGDQYIIVQSVVSASLGISLEIVNSTLQVAPHHYTLAVYNLAADRLLNYATDLPGQTFFKDTRARYKLLDSLVGVVQAASDQGTSGAYLNLEAMKNFTLGDLQTLRTPFGRRYMEIAMSFGPNLYGLS